MKQLLSILLIFIGALEAFGQDKGIQELPAEKDTIINGVETKMIFLKVKIQIEKGRMLTDVIIGFRNPETKAWIWFDATDVPFDRTGFTHSFPLKMKEGYEVMDSKYLNAIGEHEGGSTFTWPCRCNKFKHKGPV